MIAFAIAATILALLVLLAVVLPLLRGAPAGPDREAFDRAVYRDQMRELERDAARGMNHVNHVGRTWAGAWHKGRQARSQPALECVLNRADVSGIDQRACDLRAADRRAGTQGGRAHECFDIDRHPQPLKPGANLADA